MSVPFIVFLKALVVRCPPRSVSSSEKLRAVFQCIFSTSENTPVERKPVNS